VLFPGGTPGRPDSYQPRRKRVLDYLHLGMIFCVLRCGAPARPPAVQAPPPLPDGCKTGCSRLLKTVKTLETAELVDTLNEFGGEVYTPSSQAQKQQESSQNRPTIDPASTWNTPRRPQDSPPGSLPMLGDIKLSSSPLLNVDPFGSFLKGFYDMWGRSLLDVTIPGILKHLTLSDSCSFFEAVPKLPLNPCFDS
jgi:hypothetical protein